jgi:tetratricopeptide (TPR) repeat protein
MKSAGIVAAGFLVMISAVAMLSNGAAAGRPEAWKALENLQIAEATHLFKEELQKSPGDFDLTRGLFLCACFDLDIDAQDELVRDMVRAGPGNPYLLPLFEHVVAEMSDRSTCLELCTLLGAALTGQSDGRMRANGIRIRSSADRDSNRKPPGDWFEKLGLAPGCWITGPFENESNIAAYRPVPFEEGRLDTMEVVVGKDGKRAGWTWLGADRWGDLRPGIALGVAADFACQARCFFELPEEMEVLILPGGACSMRILIDCRKAYDDPRYRNAVQREGFRIRLPRGPHEITAVLGSAWGEIGFHVGILDSEYRPIKGLKWLRFAQVAPNELGPAEPVHPIFDPFQEYIGRAGTAADTPYWKAILRIYNGYEAESVRELERADEAGSLSALGIWALYRSLVDNNEKAIAVEHLGRIKEIVSTPLTDYTWIEATIEDREAQITAYEELARTYPDRLLIDLSCSFRGLVTGDYAAVLKNLDSLKEKYPESSAPYEIKRLIYQGIANDPRSAYEEYKKASKLTGRKTREIFETPSYFLAMRDYEEALKRAEEAYEVSDGSNFFLDRLVATYDLAGRSLAIAPRLESRRRRYPYNLDVYNSLYHIYNTASRFDTAQEILEEYHRLEPTAILPYIYIDSLHNYTDYDSIFGSTDVMGLWDREPSEAELGESQYWAILDRKQKIVFESGLTVEDSHIAFALLDQSSVESMQEYYLGFDPSQRFSDLLVARRLRKGQPALPGQTAGEFVNFQDLKPGDAVEIRYRLWRVGSGDLWKDFWDDYNMYSDYFQRYWEYTIYSNRDDLRYAAIPPAGEPTAGKHCGFNMTSWRGENTPAMNLGLVLQPIWDGVLGEILLSSVQSWETINRWYGSISEAVLDENPRTADLARKIAGDGETDGEKLDSLYAYIVLDIPYQIMGFDYHSAIPQKPDDVLLNRWGDCKDKAHLLIRMLREVGVEAWPILVRSRSYGTDLPIPYLGFDHLIAGCIIDGDTVLVDPSDVTFPPRRSVSREFAGQPYLPITSGAPTSIRRLPGMSVEDNVRRHEITIRPSDKGGFVFMDESTWQNQQAAERRDILSGYSRSELRRVLESMYSDSWNMVVTLDSTYMDPCESIDPLFRLAMSGTIDVPVQSIGKSTVVGPPDLGLMRRTLIPSLATDGRRDFPVDLRELAGRYETAIHFMAPDEYGSPQLAEKVVIADSLLNFVCEARWDGGKRILSVESVLEIEDGLTDLERFQPFCKRVIEAYNTPLLFTGE